MSKLCIPEAALNQHCVWLGKTGSGKSSAMRHVVENLLSRNKRVCVIDPKGDWWGLKSSADGKGPGYPVIAFGDFKEPRAQDVPINQHSGRHVAELITSGNRPCIIGFRGWYTAHMIQFWIDVASGVFNANSGELYLVADEFHNFAPKGQVKGLEGNMATCLHWSNRLLAEGRGIGIVCLMASQRPQKVHNDSLTSAETLFAMRVIHKADRDAVQDWIEGCGDMAQGREVLNSLAGMPRGDAYGWSPEIGFGPKRVSFPMFETFDSFAPPQLQKKVIQTGWAGVDLTVVKEKLAKVIEDAKANDPAELRKEITRLKAEIAKQQKAAPTVKTEVKEVSVLLDGDREDLGHLIETFDGIRSALNALNPRIDAIHSRLNAPKAPVVAAPVALRKAFPPPPTPRAPKKSPVAPTANGEPTLTRKQQEILDALAWYEHLGNPEPTTIQVGAVALIDATGGHFSNTVGPLSSNGLVNRGNGVLSLTDLGRQHARIPESVGTLDDYHEVLRRRVRQMKSASGKTVELLDVIIEGGGQELTTEYIGERAGIDHTGGHFSNTIGPLGTLGLIRRNHGIVAPTDVLFPPGLT